MKYKEINNIYLCWKERPFLKDKLMGVLPKKEANLWLSMQKDSPFGWYCIQRVNAYNLNNLFDEE